MTSTGQTDILTSGLEPHSRFPISRETSGYGACKPVTVAQPSRFSRGSLTLVVIQMDKPSIGFKERVVSTLPCESCKKNMRGSRLTV